MGIFTEEDRREMRTAATAIGVAVTLFPPFMGTRAVIRRYRDSRARVEGWARECSTCGAWFDDGIAAGSHEIATGHVTEWSR